MHDVGLELHQEIVGAGTSIDPQFGQWIAGVFFHGGQNVSDLEGDPLERSAGKVGRGGPSGDPDDCAASISVPVGSPQTGEGWNQINAIAVDDLTCQGLDLGGFFDDAQSIAQPLHRRTCDKDASFKDIALLVGSRPTDACKQALFRRNRFGADIHQHEATGSVGVFCHADLSAVLAEQGRLLISGDACDRNRGTEELGIGFRVELTGHADFGQDRFRDVQQFEQFRIPFQRTEIHQHGSTRVARIGFVDATLG